MAHEPRRAWFQEFIDSIDTVAMGRVTYGNWLRPERGSAAQGPGRPGNQERLRRRRAGYPGVPAGWLIDDITITTVPVLIGSGIPFPGELDADIALIHQSTKVLAAGLVQSAYAIDRCRPRPQMLSRQCL
jgi:hypothetical protein